MADHNLTAIVDECIARIQAGEPVDACLRDYPAYRGELAVLLDAAATLNTLPRPVIHAEARQRGREQMLAHLPQNQTRPVSFAAFLRYARQNLAQLFKKELPTMKLVLRSAVTAVFLLILSTVVVTASQSSLPGDPLYPVKRSWEWVQGSFATTDPASYEAELLERRYEELQLLIEMGRQVSFELEGWLAQMDDESFQVVGFTVQFNEETRWLTEQHAGQMVRVALVTQADGTLLAQQVAPSNLPQPQMTATPQPTAAATSTPTGCNAGACPTATPTPDCNPANCNSPTAPSTPGCNTGVCPTATPTPCNSPNCVTPTTTKTPNCNPANCNTPTAPSTPGCNNGVCLTATPLPTLTQTPNCTPATCATATPLSTATPTPCNTPNCVPPTATPGCHPANCPSATPTPGCNAGACATPTSTPLPPATATPISPATATPTPGCTPANCPTNIPTSTPGCNGGVCVTPSPTPTQCNTPNCVTPTPTPLLPNCNPAACNTPTPPGCNMGVCPTFTPTPHNHEN